MEIGEYRVESEVWWRVVCGEWRVQSQWTGNSGQCKVEWRVESGEYRVESGGKRVRCAQEKKRQEEKPPIWGSHRRFHLVFYLHRLSNLSFVCLLVLYITVLLQQTLTKLVFRFMVS